MQFPKAERLEHLPPYPFDVIGQRIKKLNAGGGLPVIRFDIGSPDMPPPDFVIEKLAEVAAKPDVHGYSGYRGTPEFRRAVADYYQRRFNVAVDPDKQVLPLIGSKEGIVNLALATLSQDDLVLTPSLAYPAYVMGAILAGADTYEMKMNAHNGFKPDFDEIPADVADRAKIMWLCYPNNPTGVLADLDYYQTAVDFCRAHDILLCFDNPYLELVFDDAGHAPSIMQVDGAWDVAVEFTSLSKSFNMAGWRIGAMVGDEQVVETLLLVKSNVDSGHFQAIYDAGTAALNQTPQQWIDERNKIYERRRDKILAALDDIHLELETTPRGSLYIWARVPDGDDIGYTETMLNEARVSLTPGSFYGEDGKGYVRISLGIADDKLDEALDRLKSYWSTQ